MDPSNSKPSPPDFQKWAAQNYGHYLAQFNGQNTPRQYYQNTSQNLNPPHQYTQNSHFNFQYTPNNLPPPPPLDAYLSNFTNPTKRKTMDSNFIPTPIPTKVKRKNDRTGVPWEEKEMDDLCDLVEIHNYIEFLSTCKRKLP